MKIKNLLTIGTIVLSLFGCNNEAEVEAQNLVTVEKGGKRKGGNKGEKARRDHESKRRDREDTRENVIPNQEQQQNQVQDTNIGNVIQNQENQRNQIVENDQQNITTIIETDDIASLRKLQTGILLNFKIGDVFPLLHYCVVKNAMKCFKHLLMVGADPYRVLFQNQDPLDCMTIATILQRNEMVEIMKEIGVNPNITTGNQFPIPLTPKPEPLFQTCTEENTDNEVPSFDNPIVLSGGVLNVKGDAINWKTNPRFNFDALVYFGQNIMFLPKKISGLDTFKGEMTKIFYDLKQFSPSSFDDTIGSQNIGSQDIASVISELSSPNNTLLDDLTKKIMRNAWSKSCDDQNKFCQLFLLDFIRAGARCEKLDREVAIGLGNYYRPFWEHISKHFFVKGSGELTDWIKKSENNFGHNVGVNKNTVTILNSEIIFDLIAEIINEGTFFVTYKNGVFAINCSNLIKIRTDKIAGVFCLYGDQYTSLTNPQAFFYLPEDDFFKGEHNFSLSVVIGPKTSNSVGTCFEYIPDHMIQRMNTNQKELSQKLACKMFSKLWTREKLKEKYGDDLFV